MKLLSPPEFQVLHEVFMDGPITAKLIEKRVRMPWGWKVRNVLLALQDLGFVEVAPINRILHMAVKAGAQIVLEDNGFGIMEPVLNILNHSMDADYPGIQDQITLHQEALYNYLQSRIVETWDVTAAGSVALRTTRQQQGLK